LSKFAIIYLRLVKKGARKMENLNSRSANKKKRGIEK